MKKITVCESTVPELPVIIETAGALDIRSLPSGWMVETTGHTSFQLPWATPPHIYDEGAVFSFSGAETGRIETE